MARGLKALEFSFGAVDLRKIKKGRDRWDIDDLDGQDRRRRPAVGDTPSIEKEFIAR